VLEQIFFLKSGLFSGLYIGIEKVGRCAGPCGQMVFTFSLYF